MILSHLSKAACFTYELGNCDINAIEQANILKFSKLDALATHLRLS